VSGQGEAVSPTPEPAAPVSNERHRLPAQRSSPRVCLDTGNRTTPAEDPALTTEILVPYILMTHVRDSLVRAVEIGARTQWVSLGAGNNDLPRIAALMKEHAPKASFVLELITAGAPRPVPYLDPASPRQGGAAGGRPRP
jgi:sugar phosphate isomerase/epimerase